MLCDIDAPASPFSRHDSRCWSLTLRITSHSLTKAACIADLEAHGESTSRWQAEQSTPIQDRRQASTRNAAENLKSPNLPATPKSAGISGTARRVPLRNLLEPPSGEAIVAKQAAGQVPGMSISAILGDSLCSHICILGVLERTSPCGLYSPIDVLSMKIDAHIYFALC